MGYSIGRVDAIGAELDLNMTNTPNFDSLSVLLPEWNLAEIQLHAIVDALWRRYGLMTEMWTSMLKELEAIKEMIDPVFARLIWDQGDAINFTKCVNQITLL